MTFNRRSELDLLPHDGMFGRECHPGLLGQDETRSSVFARGDADSAVSFKSWYGGTRPESEGHCI